MHSSSNGCYAYQLSQRKRHSPMPEIAQQQPSSGMKANITEKIRIVALFSADVHST
jgi:hypothetical protein